MNHRRRPLRGIVAIVAALAACAALPAGASAAGECAALANCTSLPNTPWLAVPAGIPGERDDGKGAIVRASTVLWRTNCPDGRIAAGRDYNVSDPSELLVVTALVLPFGYGLTGGGDAANVFAYWQGKQPTSFQPLVGCVPAASGASVRDAARSRLRQRVVTRRLRPSRSHGFGHGCRRGERLSRSEYGIAFHQPKPPSARELRQLDVVHRRRGGRVSLRVRTGADVGDDERVTVQLHAICRDRRQTSEPAAPFAGYTR